MDRSSLILSPLSRWIEDNAAHIGVPIAVDKFSTGQSNPTYRLTTDQDGVGGQFVLRTQPPDPY